MANAPRWMVIGMEIMMEDDVFGTTDANFSINRLVRPL